MTRVLMIGGRGTAVVVLEQILDAVERLQLEVDVIGYAFDDESLGGSVNGVPIVCKTYEAWNRFGPCEDVMFMYQLYRPDVMAERVALFEQLKIPSERLYTFIHPSCMVARSAVIGAGTALCANVVVNANAVIGRCVTINSGALVGHDTHIDDFNFIAGHTAIGSNVRLGTGNFIGLNSSVRNFVTTGDYNIVGAASNVVKPLGSEQVWYGNPASMRPGLGGAIR